MNAVDGDEVVSWGPDEHVSTVARDVLAELGDGSRWSNTLTKLDSCEWSTGLARLPRWRARRSVVLLPPAHLALVVPAL